MYIKQGLTGVVTSLQVDNLIQSFQTLPHGITTNKIATYTTNAKIAAMYINTQPDAHAQMKQIIQVKKNINQDKCYQIKK